MKNVVGNIQGHDVIPQINMEKEIWKDIPNFGTYQASNLGRIRNSKSIGKKECLKTKVTKNGYEEVSVSIDGKPYTKSVHRLVAITFLENPENKPEVDHIDSNKLNNRADNLRWATREENLQNDLYYGNKMKRMLSQGSIKKLITEKQAKITKLQQEIEALKTQLEDEI